MWMVTVNSINYLFKSDYDYHGDVRKYHLSNKLALMMLFAEVKKGKLQTTTSSFSESLETLVMMLKSAQFQHAACRE